MHDLGTPCPTQFSYDVCSYSREHQHAASLLVFSCTSSVQRADAASLVPETLVSCKHACWTSAMLCSVAHLHIIRNAQVRSIRQSHMTWSAVAHELCLCFVPLACAHLSVCRCATLHRIVLALQACLHGSTVLEERYQGCCVCICILSQIPCHLHSCQSPCRFEAVRNACWVIATEHHCVAAQMKVVSQHLL